MFLILCYTEEQKNLKISFSSERKVAFSASLSGGESGQTGPYSADFTLIYKHVFINIGKAYNPATGIFTAPVRGVYQFRFSIHGGAGRHVTVVFHKNGHHIAGTHAFQSGGSVSSSNGVSLLLEAGDVVCLKVRANAWVFDDWFHHTTFSGQMLFSALLIICPKQSQH
ncbi:complement C1q-like protein 4 [Astyanax mexicanus]|uniref:Complement C1q-like protein 4 n=1 Tax=Astyanax mexicanus TaxID=7994 RepID=A0A8T2MGE5_ASTMX|nr:complement C1q-like protein 4 [Astyanax mexicanus]